MAADPTGSTSTLFLPYAFWPEGILGVPTHLHSFLPQDICTSCSYWKVLSPDSLTSFILFSSLLKYQRSFYYPLHLKEHLHPHPFFYPHYPALFFFIGLTLFYICIYSLIFFLIFLWKVCCMRSEYFSYSLCIQYL